MNDYDFEDMYEDKFDNIEELNEFIENMETYTQDKVYYWGAIEDFDGELHTIEELKKEACEGWFKNGSVVTVYNFYKKIYCAILSKCEDDSKVEVVDNNFEKAIDKAMENWKNYADSEKYSRHEYAIFAYCPISNQVVDSYNILWADGDFADIEKYDELSIDSFEAKKAAQMIREYRILKNRNPLLMKEHEDFIAKITEEMENDERYEEQEKETILNQLRKEFLIQEK